jgi:hypothetical protein
VAAPRHRGRARCCPGRLACRPDRRPADRNRQAVSTRRPGRHAPGSDAPGRDTQGSQASQHPPHSTGKPRSGKDTSTLPPAAAAAARFVGDLQAAVTDGQVTQQAGQDLFSHLQQLLFGPPGQNTQQIQQQYEQVVQSYDQHQSQGQITGTAAARLRSDLAALGAAVGAS